MNITINNRRISGFLHAVEYAPFVHRYLIGHVLTEGHELPELFNYSDPIMTTMDCLNTLNSQQKTYLLDCRSSMLTCELVLPLAAALGYNCEFHFNRTFPEWPVTNLFKALKVHGIRHEFLSGSRMRMWGKLTAGTFIIPAEAGNGFLSGLLMALPLLQENSVVMVSGALDSLDDIAMTMMVMKDCGIQIDAQFADPPRTYSADSPSQKQGTYIGATFKIPGNQQYYLKKLPDIEGDWGLASFFLTAGAVCGGPVTLSGLNVRSLQKNRAILDILKYAGATVEYGILHQEDSRKGPVRSILYKEEAEDADYIRITGCRADPTDLEHFFQTEHLQAIDVDLYEVPDLLPAVVLLATCAQGVSCIRGIDRSDPLQSFRTDQIIEKLENQGIMIWEAEGSLYIEGYASAQPLAGGITGSRGDDRLAMMEGIGACISSLPVVIEDAEAVERTYPDFFEDLKRLQVV